MSHACFTPVDCEPTPALPLDTLTHPSILSPHKLEPGHAHASASTLTSFGKMLARSSLLVAVTDSEGNSGWGECWCNFPSGGMAYKVRLYDDTLAPLP